MDGGGGRVCPGQLRSTEHRLPPERARAAEHRLVEYTAASGICRRWQTIPERRVARICEYSTACGAQHDARALVVACC